MANFAASLLSGQQIFDTPELVKGKISAVNIYNGTGLHVITIEDVFTPDASNGVPSPSAITKTRLKVSANSGQTYGIDRLYLEDIECLGAVNLIGDVADSSCLVSVNYHFDSGS